ncbi:hypothetical protein E2C01_014810 [Portunus trituberculatus]|uniref:Uncharacterized protein n=1 Tax=Portunus trituberculatus TaxID=210409 RepID=A0A5B7DK23_PORTR|nr:hypothetical protein [Portunus trituberculatus]
MESPPPLYLLVSRGVRLCMASCPRGYHHQQQQQRGACPPARPVANLCRGFMNSLMSLKDAFLPLTFLLQRVQLNRFRAQGWSPRAADNRAGAAGNRCVVQSGNFCYLAVLLLLPPQQQQEVSPLSHTYTCRSLTLPSEEAGNDQMTTPPVPPHTFPERIRQVITKLSTWCACRCRDGRQGGEAAACPRCPVKLCH